MTKLKNQQHVDDDLEIDAIEGFLVDVQVYMHELMERKGISRAELARRMGLSRARVTQMFTEDSNITVRQLARVAFHLGESPRVESDTTRLLRNEREGGRRDAAVGAAANVVPLWQDTSSANPADVQCTDNDSRINGIIMLARRVGNR